MHCCSHGINIFSAGRRWCCDPSFIGLFKIRVVKAENLAGADYSIMSHSVTSDSYVRVRCGATVRVPVASLSDRDLTLNLASIPSVRGEIFMDTIQHLIDIENGGR